MKKILTVALAVMLLAGVAGLVGCGSKVTVKTDKGEVTIDEKNDEVRVKTDEGDVTLSTKVPTEAELGVPIYPNAKMDNNSSLTTGDTAVAVLWTEDSPDKVIAWYKDQLSGKPEFMVLTETGTEALMTFQSGNEIKMVTIGKNTVDHPGTTSIGIGSGIGGTPSQTK